MILGVHFSANGSLSRESPPSILQSDLQLVFQTLRRWSAWLGLKSALSILKYNTSKLSVAGFMEISAPQKTTELENQFVHFWLRVSSQRNVLFGAKPRVTGQCAEYKNIIRKYKYSRETWHRSGKRRVCLSKWLCNGSMWVYWIRNANKLRI